MRAPAEARPSQPALSRSAPAKAQGSALIESLVAVLLFSVGLLGLVGMQAGAVQQASQAEYRSMASLLANAAASQMWASDRTATTLQTQFASPSGSAYALWLAQVQASGLPGISSANSTLPTISFSTLAGGGSGGTARSQATITVYWRAPADTQSHQVVTLVQMK